MAAPPEGGNTVEERKNSAARIRANNKYAAKAYDRINIAVPKGRKDAIQEHAQQQGESINAFIGRAILEAMERDGGGTASETAGKSSESTQGGGVVSLPYETLEIAQRAAEAVGEAVPDFVRRAVETQAQRDQASLRLGINPTMGNKLEENQD